MWKEREQDSLSSRGDKAGFLAPFRFRGQFLSSYFHTRLRAHTPVFFFTFFAKKMSHNWL
ncbi:MAG: hypothetical protein DWQ01_08545 [Planctomycetota bacterium]|nr:MAG: hypothetical protein DWQ01_08545 [Planctomycetota bacterium]